MDLIEPLSQTFDHAAKVLSGVGPDQLDAPTPCTEWDVRTLAGHIMGVTVNMGRGAAGEEPLAGPDAVPLESDLGAQFRTEADRTLAAWKARGIEGDVNVGAGPMPVTLALSVNLVDTATHTWDVACATGQDPRLPDGLATTVLAVGQGFITDDLRQMVGFDAPIEVADDADPTDKLVAFLGRRP